MRKPRWLWTPSCSGGACETRLVGLTWSQAGRCEAAEAWVDGEVDEAGALEGVDARVAVEVGFKDGICIVQRLLLVLVDAGCDGAFEGGSWFSHGESCLF